MNNPYMQLESTGHKDNWRADAACLGLGDQWFPEDTGSSADAKLARRICAECPVRVPCLQFALDTKQRYGIWGGTTAASRNLMLRRLRRGEPAPETVHTLSDANEREYNRHIINGTVPCAACRRAHSLFGADRRRRARQEGRP